MKIYVASSWKNTYQPKVVEALREVGHEVYDFKNPPNKTGFGWEEIEGGADNWTIPQYIKNLGHPAAEAGFKSDFEAMKWCDAVLMVGGCGSSAHLELGWGAGAGKKTYVYLPEMRDPELMVLVADMITDDLDMILVDIWFYELQAEFTKHGWPENYVAQVDRNTWLEYYKDGVPAHEMAHEEMAAGADS